MTSVLDPVLRRWPAWALLISAAMLATAHAFETFGGLAPCTLCLQQRDVYWTAMGVAGVALVFAFTPARARLGPLFVLALAGVFLVGAFIAGRHAGAEWKWWPGPATCSGGGGGVNAAAIASLMHGAKVAAPRCDEAAWRMLGLSMAGWNFLVSLGLTGLSLMAFSAARRQSEASR